MFKVKWKYNKNSKPEIVYSVRKMNSDITEFLMYQFGGWYWRDADSYEPLEDEV